MWNGHDEGSAMQTATQTQVWITYKDAELRTGLSRSVLYRLGKSGEVRVAKVGRAVRINRSDLDEYMTCHIAEREGSEQEGGDDD